MVCVCDFRDLCPRLSPRRSFSESRHNVPVTSRFACLPIGRFIKNWIRKEKLSVGSVQFSYIALYALLNWKLTHWSSGRPYNMPTLGRHIFILNCLVENDVCLLACVQYVSLLRGLTAALNIDTKSTRSQADQSVMKVSASDRDKLMEDRSAVCRLIVDTVQTLRQHSDHTNHALINYEHDRNSLASVEESLNY